MMQRLSKERQKVEGVAKCKSALAGAVVEIEIATV